MCFSKLKLKRIYNLKKGYVQNRKLYNKQRKIINIFFHHVTKSKKRKENQDNK